MAKAKFGPELGPAYPLGKRLKIPHWTEPPIHYEKALAAKGKPVMYFKTEAGRHGGRRIIYRYYCVYQSGLMTYVDMTRMKFGVCLSVGQPYRMAPSNKREYQREYRKFLKLIECTG